MEGSVAQRIRLIDQLTQAVLHQHFCSQESVFGRFLALEQNNMEGRHQLCRCSNGCFGSALDQKFEEIDFKQGRMVDWVKLVVALNT